MSLAEALQNPTTESFAHFIEKLAFEPENPNSYAGLELFESPQETPSSDPLGDAAKEFPEHHANDDLAFVSYEKALRTHSRYKSGPEPIPDASLPQNPPRPSSIPHVAKPADLSSPQHPVASNSELMDDLDPAFSQQIDSPVKPPQSGQQIQSDRSGLTQQILNAARAAQQLELKRCTISVRLNLVESEILRLRAAESGMTISAYLRSCVLEADQLRAQVKQALAELRSKTTECDSPSKPFKKQNRSFRAWIHALAETLRFSRIQSPQHRP
jgi:hypothetical protein